MFLQPPTAASVELRFSVPKPAGDARGDPAVAHAVTVARATGGLGAAGVLDRRPVAVAAGETSVDVTAYHAGFVEGELAGHGTSMPRLTVMAKHPPIVAPTGTDLDLIVGVEVERSEMDARAPSVHYEGHTYRIWREVSNFTNLPPDALAYVADRATGTISFAPALRMMRGDGALEDMPRTLAAVPAAKPRDPLVVPARGRTEGNVAAGTLTTLKDPIPGVTGDQSRSGRGRARGRDARQRAAARAAGVPLAAARGHRRATSSCSRCEARGRSVRGKAFTKSVALDPRDARDRGGRPRARRVGP